MFVVFFSTTATPEFDTYLDTLSLHDALPIAQLGIPPVTGARAAFAVVSGRAPSAAEAASGSSMALFAAASAPVVTCASATVGSAAPTRSEEHTSELRSLMRISYAVFCLKTTRTTRRSRRARMWRDQTS